MASTINVILSRKEDESDTDRFIMDLKSKNKDKVKLRKKSK